VAVAVHLETHVLAEVLLVLEEMAVEALEVTQPVVLLDLQMELTDLAVVAEEPQAILL
jgi:hypothetical protein